MNLHFLIDEQLPPRLAQWLRSEGFDALHVLECSMAGTSDAAVYAFAAQTHRVLITKDADFAVSRRQKVQVVWLRFGNISSNLLLTRFGQCFAEISEALRQGEELIEIA
jgi:predicted nuclease of predicted toxin-antitoxin system